MRGRRPARSEGDSITALATLQSIIAQGESETLEMKRSTAELRRAGESLCAFLNGEGGQVLIAVAPDGKIVGQQVSDGTLRDIAAMLGRFEPPAFGEQDGAVYVTFRSYIGSTAKATSARRCSAPGRCR